MKHNLLRAFKGPLKWDFIIGILLFNQIGNVSLTYFSLENSYKFYSLYLFGLVSFKMKCPLIKGLNKSSNLVV